ncbi:LysM peptidoglycan-binding domain-containing protein [Lysinibacillus agricola]|uniref:LysM peptidoglycan-binding domain-containing protein n=1 Tax=Lysinibacillus agricola TaxID=2590012 RepID=A0ABX7AVH2_9BACI|nr:MULTISPECIES: 3D domain-containing protein [Lysinibacillus]KOS61287.1 peptidoglycan-binding protein [Lysinibacillus sp. FJAT-14222]QQP12873.1 LysM peptidoglycan-binding domain-containing protein [Lysinibacillus agricola]
MKKQALALAVALTLGLSSFASSSSAEDKLAVMPFDALWGISKIYNLAIGEFESLSEIDPKWFYPEQNLNADEAKNEKSLKDEHFVEHGDTLFAIARENDVAVDELKEWNNLTSDLIYVGESLAIKASAAKPKTSVSKTNKLATTSNTKKATTSSTTTSSTTASSTTTTSAPANDTGKTLTMRATAYTAYCEGCSGITANGTDIRSNPNLKVIAVDPRVIPLGTRVWVEGYGEAIAADTGGAIKGNKIDVFIPTEGQARQWGVKSVTVKILN